MKIAKEKNRGITLIALILTIIVMLILSGLSIGMLTTNNNVIKSANNAKTLHSNAKELEILQLSAVKILSEEVKQRKRLSEEEVRQIIIENANNDKIDVIDEDGSYIIEFTESENFYKIENEGNAVPFEVEKDKNPGDITKDKDGNALNGNDKAYEIWCIEDLIEWSKNYNQYKTYNIKLCKSLDFNKKLSYTNSKSLEYEDINGDGTTETIIEEMKKGKGFTPINTFSGTFDGQSFKIENIYCNDFQYSGLFGKISNSTVKNLTITGNIKRTTNGGFNGGICGSASNSVIENCSNYVVLAGQNTGGIAGGVSKAKIINCLNISDVNGRNQHGTGGLVGRCLGNLDVINSFNIGKVKMANGIASCGAGGIYGKKDETTIVVNITNSFTIGVVESSRNKGIFGTITGTNTTITHCYCINSSLNDISGDTTIYSTRLTENQMKNIDEIENGKTVIDLLNEYVNDYNETNKDNTDFIKLNNWQVGTNDYPTFIK